MILATSSPTPVVDAAWIDPCAYLTTLGSRQQGRPEFGLDLPATASLLVSDSLDQIGAMTRRTCSHAKVSPTRWAGQAAPHTFPLAMPASGGQVHLAHRYGPATQYHPITSTDVEPA